MASPVVAPPAILPADFNGWDKTPPKTLPADFAGWDKPNTPAQPVGVPAGVTLGQPAAHPAVNMRGGEGNLETIPALQSQPGVMGSVQTGVHNFGARVANNGLGLLKPVLHPIQSGNEILQRGAFPITPDAIRATQYNPSGPDAGATVANVLGDAATAFLTHKVAQTIPKIGSGVRSGAANLGNIAIGTAAGDVNYGADPGRAISSNRIIGTNPATLSTQLKTLIPDAAADHRAVVASAPPNVRINTGPLVTEPFDSQIAAKTDPKTGVAAPTQINRAGMTRRLLTNVPDEVTGRPTPMMRDPNLTPLEATNLKSNIYDMADYDNPSQSALSNKGLKGAARNIKVAVEQAVPESVPSGQRLHDMMAAKDILEPQSRFVKIPTSKSGIIDRLVTGGTTSAAAGLDVAGEKLQNLGKYLKAPYLLPASLSGRRN